MSESIRIVAKDLVCRYEDNESFHLEIPDFTQTIDSPVGIYGLIGSGKSSLGQMIAGLIQPTSGEVRASWEPTAGKSEAPKVVYLPQFPEKIFLGSRVGETVELIAQMNPSIPDFVSDIRKLLSRFSVDYAAISERNGYELSGGELRRFALSLGIARQPDLLILDEPTIGLGKIGRAQLTEIAGEFSKNHALIVISHDFDLLAALSDQFWIMEQGRIVFHGNISELAADYFQRETVGLKFFKAFATVSNSR